MMKAILSTVGIAIALAPSASPEIAQFRINGVDFEVAAPPQSCLPNGHQVDAMQLLAAGDRDNVTHVTFLTCGENVTGKAGRYWLVKTVTALLSVDMTREELLIALTPTFNAGYTVEETAKILENAEANVSSALGAKVEYAGDVQPRGVDKTCAYVGGAIQVTAGTLKYDQAVGGCLTVVGRRQITVYRYGNKTDSASIIALMQEARDFAATIKVVPKN